MIDNILARIFGSELAAFLLTIALMLTFAEIAAKEAPTDITVTFIESVNETIDQ
jgi:hypothetical protein